MVGDGALVGKVTAVDSTVSIVTLITDPTVRGAPPRCRTATGDTGVLKPAVGNPNELLLQDLPKPSGSEAGRRDTGRDRGFVDQSEPQLRLLYPRGLPIGTVSNVNINNCSTTARSRSSPDADLRDLSSCRS